MVPVRPMSALVLPSRVSFQAVVAVAKKAAGPR
jgi:hypothetical protein